MNSPSFRLATCAGRLAALALTAAAARAGLAADAPTYHKDIEPIVFANCSGCHRPGEVAPFTLLSYEDAKKKAKLMATVTRDRVMPPWKVEPGWGKFLDERRLTDDQIALIQRWAEAGAPEGNAADAPPAPKFVEGWQLGEPDLILKMPEPFAVPAEGRDVYRCFVLPIDIPENKWVRAVEYRPGNRKVVHHAILFMDRSGEGRRRDEADPGPGYRSMGGVGFVPSGGLGGWAPGVTPRTMPEGAAKKIAKGTDLVLQVHFHPDGKPEEEQSSVGLFFSDTPPTRFMLPLVLGSNKIDIPAGEKLYRVEDSMTLPAPIELSAVAPHAHLICKEMKVWADLPGGKKTGIIWIKDWDFNWQGQYQFVEPLRLPKGATIRMEYTYDNSAENPRNPSNPPKRVHRGEQTTDEMAFLFMQYFPEKLGDVRDLALATREHLTTSMRGGRGLVNIAGGNDLADLRERLGGGAAGGAGATGAGAGEGGGRLTFRERRKQRLEQRARRNAPAEAAPEPAKATPTPNADTKPKETAK